jgi:hypothetical protein
MKIDWTLFDYCPTCSAGDSWSCWAVSGGVRMQYPHPARIENDEQREHVKAVKRARRGKGKEA